jgi:hypothetical protein
MTGIEVPFGYIYKKPIEYLGTSLANARIVSLLTGKEEQNEGRAGTVIPLVD